jgi:hypothetical protein
LLVANTTLTGLVRNKKQAIHEALRFPTAKVPVQRQFQFRFQQRQLECEFHSSDLGRLGCVFDYHGPIPEIITANSKDPW